MKTILTITFLFIVNLGFTQNYKFGKISKDELQEKFNPADTSANATILYSSQNIYYDFRNGDGFIQIIEIYKRIKIYNKNGYDWATFNIRLYNNTKSQSQIIKAIKGFTYYLNNGKIEKVKLKSEGVFQEKLNDYWVMKKITMPNINDGVIVEIKYSIESPFMGIQDVILQESIPIKKLDFEIKIPEFFNYNKLLNPKSSYYPKIIDMNVDRKELVRSKTEGSQQIVNKFRQSTSNNNMSEWKFMERKTMVHETNIPVLINEPMLDNINVYRAKIAWDYAFFKGLDGRVESYSSTWNKVVENIYNSDGFGKQLDKSAYFKDDIDDLLEEVELTTEKAALIFNFIKTKIKWNGSYGYHTYNGVRLAYKEGNGNVSDINLALTAMLRYAGINANPVLISTRNNGVPLFPTRSGFNYVIAAIEIADDIIMLDATSHYSVANILPKRCLNWQGRIVREYGSSAWVNLLPKQISKEVTSINIKINDDLSVDGKVRKLLTNYLALDYREDYANLNNEQLIRIFEEDKVGVEISNLRIKDLNELSKPLSYSYDYHFENGIEEIGDKLYFSPLLFLTPEENPFKQESRQYPVDFIYPVSEKYTVNIMLPSSYIVDYLPKSTKIQFNDTDGEFTYLVRENGKMLQLIINLEINNPLILPNDYDLFKKFFELMLEKQTEKVVLKKE